MLGELANIMRDMMYHHFGRMLKASQLSIKISKIISRRYRTILSLL